MSRCRPPMPKLLTIAILAVLPALSAHAQSQPQPQPRPQRGEVLSAERVQYDGRDMHRVKVVDDQGRVRVFMQDPQHRDGNGNPPRGDSRGSRRPPPARDDDG